MKSLLRKFFGPVVVLLLMALAAGPAFAQFQPTPPINPVTATQGVYIDANFHSVPYAIVTPNSGLTTVVFDPSTSVTDQSNAFGHLKKAVSSSQTGGGQPLQLLVLPGVVSTNVRNQITRTVVPFSVTASTTLQTIPFSVATYVETGGHYTFRASLFINTGGGGSKIDIGGTCNTSNFVAQYRALGATTTVYGGLITSFLSGPSGSNTVVTEIIVEGEMDVTNGGTFVVQFAQNSSNATAATVLAGSTLRLTQIP